MSRPLVVVTGAAGSLGKAVAKAFLQDEVRLVLVDISNEGLAKAHADLAAEHLRIAVDLTDAAAVEDALAPVFEQHGAANVLCNIAGGFNMGPAVHGTSDQAWRQLIDLNVGTLINASRATVPGMVAAGRGKVINVAAASAVTGSANMGAYCASKSAVARLTESMALELRESGVNVNAVAPSILDTPANRSDMPDADPARWVSLQDLGQVIRFLASPGANAIHGAVIPVVGLS